jgi:hypothetical protein
VSATEEYSDVESNGYEEDAPAPVSAPSSAVSSSQLFAAKLAQLNDEVTSVYAARRLSASEIDARTGLLHRLHTLVSQKVDPGLGRVVFQTNAAVSPRDGLLAWRIRQKLTDEEKGQRVTVR